MGILFDLMRGQFQATSARYSHNLKTAMLLQSSKFAISAFILVLLYYFWRQQYVITPLLRADILSNHSMVMDDALKVNQTTAEIAVEEEPYSVKQQVSNSTFGVCLNSSFQKIKIGILSLVGHWPDPHEVSKSHSNRST